MPHLSGTIDALVPAKNEESTVGDVVRSLFASGSIRQVIVVVNGCRDETASRAHEAGALVLRAADRGLGYAVKSGLAKSDAEIILKTDGDIANWNPSWVEALRPPDAHCLTRAVFDSPYDTFPVTRLVVEPLLRRVWPNRESIRLPISGTYAFHRAHIDASSLSDDWAFDISLVCQAIETDLTMIDVEIGSLDDRSRPIDHYVPMADEIIKYFLARYGERLMRNATTHRSDLNNTR